MNTAISTVHPWHSLRHSRVARVWPGLLSLSQWIARDLLFLRLSILSFYLRKKKKTTRLFPHRALRTLHFSLFSVFFSIFFFLSVLLKYFPSNFLIFIYDYFIDCIVILTVPILKVQIKGVFLLSVWSLLSKFSFFLSFPFFFLPYGSLRSAERLTFFF